MSISPWIQGYEIITDDAAQRYVESRPLELLRLAWELEKFRMRDVTQLITCHSVTPSTPQTTNGGHDG